MKTGMCMAVGCWLLAAGKQLEAVDISRFSTFMQGKDSSHVDTMHVTPPEQ
jgi:hypothetical protein